VTVRPCRDPSLLCRVSTVFVRGMLACWTPRLREALHRQTSASPGTGAGAGKKPDKSKAKGGVSLLAQCAGAEEELREALQVLLMCQTQRTHSSSTGRPHLPVHLGASTT